MTNANKENLYAHVEFLTTLRPFRNYQNLESLEKSKNYIAASFKSAGLEPEEQKWLAEGNEYTNVIASYKPDKAVRLIVGAHYDVCGDQPGADDNASAVAGLLELARMVVANQPNLEYGIDFVAYCLEEPPFWETDLMGSFIHAESLHKKGVEVKGMIAFEMIGFFSEEPNSQKSPFPELADITPDKANFIVVVGTDRFEEFTFHFYTAMAKNSEIDVHVLCLDEADYYATLSDHRNYLRFDIPGLMINDTSYFRNPNYHEPTDTIDTLNFEKMAAVINGTYDGVIAF